MAKNIFSVILLPVAIFGCALINADKGNQASTASTPVISPVITTKSEAITKAEIQRSPINQPEQIIASNFRRVDSFTIDELFAAHSGGCGMSLQKKSAKGTRNFVFFNGIAPNSMLMKINGKMTKFRLVEATGNDFYGQKNFQTFVSEDQAMEVRVAVVQGAAGEIESLDIDTGVMLIKVNGSFQQLEVFGDAGC
ncbi:hypothetical protein PseudUWO311_20130 [Pseudanabaena sp. UWO311]|uniref:hypothetical protein n=1 Tax=Pseudanabaena sp. UWO311 TaxID=2487337 RepID=UPI00115A58C5|nr:hypothetical protein [Pseudanabaena sp. UWO311]TYQ24094.1 hypothetical protein PseudUWO311_20130 [Pseudanabaena sp. UWO311]